MSRWRRFVAAVTRLRYALVRDRVDDETAAEFAAHLELLEQRYVTGGMTRGDARAAARRQFGNAVAVREEVYRMNTIGLADELGRDLRHAVRALRRRPAFTFAVVLTLGLGIGANTAIFAVVDGVLFKSLPYPDADRLVSLDHVAPGSGMDDFRLSPTQWLTYREHGRVFDHLGLWGAGGTTVIGVGEPEQARALAVTVGVLDALGTPPALGRLFLAGDTTGDPSATAAVILAHGYWQRRFGGDPGVVGRRLQIDSRPAEVVGVMPAGFRFLDMEPQAEVILTLGFNPATLMINNFSLAGLARLKPGVTLAEANADVARLLPLWLDSWPAPPAFSRQTLEGWRIAPALRPLKDDVVGSAGDLLWVLMGTIGIVLLIACANVANLLLVRTESRRQEFAVRAALGAGRARIVREVLAESVVMGLAGGAVGVLVAYGAVQLVVSMAPVTLPRVEDIALDARALVFAVGLSLGSGLLFGALPALRYASRPAAVGTARGASAGRDRQRARHALVVVQVALALVLLVASGLMIRTFQALSQVQPGFTRPDEVQTARIWIPPQQVRDSERVTRMQHEIVDRIAALPSVKAAGFASQIPLEGRQSFVAMTIDGHTFDSETPPVRRFKHVSPGYLRAVGTRVVAGRDLTWSEVYQHRPVVMVSENFAREIWGEPSAALGRRVRPPQVGTGPNAWREIIGVVEDVREDALHEPAPTFVYLPPLVEHLAGWDTVSTPAINLVIRSEQAGSPALLDGVRRAVWTANPNLPVFLVRTLRDLYDESIARTQFAMVILALSGAMALGLGLVGVYGVIAYVVANRTREIGIRLALGAAPASVLRMFIRHGLTLAGAGVVVGIGLASGLARLMSSLLFATSPLDAVTYASVLAVLLAACALASYLPARRAARVSPVDALLTD